LQKVLLSFDSQWVPKFGAVQMQLPSGWADPWPLHVAASLYWHVGPAKPPAQAVQLAPVKPVVHWHWPLERALPRPLQVTASL
jgi:hypothetical protein